MSAMKRGGWTCVARSAAITATATKRARRRKVNLASRLVSSTATATIGPNSPMAPTDKIEGPIAVRSTPASCRIGRSVPSAVVVRQRATTTESSTSPVPWRKAPTPSASTNEAAHEPAALPRWPWRMVDRSSSVPARNMRYVKPSWDSAVTMLFGWARFST